MTFKMQVIYERDTTENCGWSRHNDEARRY